MPVLVENSCPLFTKDVLDQCHAVNLKTVADFIMQDPEDLSKKIKLSYKDILTIRHNLIAQYAAYPQNAESLHHELLDSLLILDTGSVELNRFLSGGIYTGEVTEIYGPAASGKTQFCLSLTSKLIMESRHTAIYLDTNNNCDSKRMEQIILNSSGKDQALINKMNNVKIKDIYSVYELLDTLDLLKIELCKRDNIFFNNLKLIVIDSITPLLSPCFGGIFLDGPGILSNVARQFKILCTEHMLSVVVCNNAVSDKIFHLKPALGPSWKYVPSVSLSVTKSISGSHKISMLKSCRNGLHGDASFHITEAGITN